MKQATIGTVLTGGSASSHIYSMSEVVNFLIKVPLVLDQSTRSCVQRRQR
ncbi:hypothetical protein ACOWPH_07460 [Anabaena sp. PCC 7938]|nr:hypothetical protein [Anabaena sp. CCAP 1446/1C]MCM2409540.1 hypothetical protein [Anabaena sp. CCAP 1446/1C]